MCDTRLWIGHFATSLFNQVNSSSLDLDLYIKIMIVLYMHLTFSLSSMQEYLGKPIRVSLYVLGRKFQSGSVI
jgi:hypothetical protein